MTEVRGAPSDDTVLVRELLRGSEAALSSLYDRYGEAIFASAYRLTADRGIAEEVVQETFLTLWNRAELFDPMVGSLAAWLHAIGRNRAVDRLRAAGRRPRLVALSSSSPGESETQGLERAVANGTVVAGAVQPPGPEEAADASGLRDAIRVAMTGMPDALVFSSAFDSVVPSMAAMTSASTPLTIMFSTCASWFGMSSSEYCRSVA